MAGCIFAAFTSPSQPLAELREAPFSYSISTQGHAHSRETLWTLLPLLEAQHRNCLGLLGSQPREELPPVSVSPCSCCSTVSGRQGVMWMMMNVRCSEEIVGSTMNCALTAPSSALVSLTWLLASVGLNRP